MGFLFSFFFLNFSSLKDCMDLGLASDCRKAVGGYFFGNPWYYVLKDEYDELVAKQEEEVAKERALLSPEDRLVQEATESLHTLQRELSMAKAELQKVSMRKNGWKEKTAVDTRITRLKTQIEKAKEHVKSAKAAAKKKPKKKKASSVASRKRRKDSDDDYDE